MAISARQNGLFLPIYILQMCWQSNLIYLRISKHLGAIPGSTELIFFFLALTSKKVFVVLNTLVVFKNESEKTLHYYAINHMSKHHRHFVRDDR